jgi:Domain of unknown function (DUF4389)
VPYPVTFEADYVEGRSRLTTFFRLILAIPHLFVLALWGLVVELVVVIAWFALLFTGRYPFTLYQFVATFLRYATYVNGYYNLLCDPYPPFSGDGTEGYPVRLQVGPPKERYSRLKVFFRWLLAIPVALIMWAMQIVAHVGSFIAWFAIVILGRQPRGLQDMIALGLSYQMRAYPYLFLLTEEWPPFVDERSANLDAPASPSGALPEAPVAPERPEAPTTPEAEPVPPQDAAPPEPDAQTTPEPPTEPPGEEPPTRE